MDIALSSSNIISLLEASLKALRSSQEEIDRLNVFPVPDGDTGTNMVLTVEAAYVEAVNCRKSRTENLTTAISRGSLLGARGNSGVILSQIIKGVCEVLGARDAINAPLFIEALYNGASTAYGALKEPVEGTILTVVNDMAAQAKKFKDKNLDVITVIEAVQEEAWKSVERTPELLPVLKQAGVVDAGGYGLAVMGEGVLAVLKHEELAIKPVFNIPLAPEQGEVSLDYAYCTEFLLKGKDVDRPKLEDRLAALGDSVMVVGSDEVTKVHVHTNSPGNVLEITGSLGSMSQINIKNMVEQEKDWIKRVSEEKKRMEGVGIVAVARGEGIKKILTSLGVGKIVEGGQGKNPSSAELASAVNQISSTEVVVLPNNKNNILAAEKVKDLVEKPVEMIPTESIPQALSVLLEYDPESSLNTNTERMKKAIAKVKTGEITKSIRDSKFDNQQINKGDFIGIHNGKIEVVSDSIIETAVKLVAEMIDEEDEVITLLAGQEVSEELSQEIGETFCLRYPDLEVETHRGEQPVYHFFIGVE